MAISPYEAKLFVEGKRTEMLDIKVIHDPPKGCSTYKDYICVIEFSRRETEFGKTYVSKKVLYRG